ncbi:uncharacterized protein LOC117176787 [Belonocnema kinseyi]|uniref:uncharacterized protein LOC117176787 n=1 Tax=Belonocnema kinseyi TaxID=2817044 RepID=UPI00143D7BC3|nr:uncharacterized protein LOC117176787 [Belonocnema kinseyi]
MGFHRGLPKRTEVIRVQIQENRCLPLTIVAIRISVKHLPKARKSLRRRLQDRFEDDYSTGNSSFGKETKGPEKKDCSGNSGSGRSWHNLSFGNVRTDSRKALQNGAERISKTISNVKVTFGNISQRFKISTRRRHRLEEQFTPDGSAAKSATPQTRSRHLLGRTPTKLYSPFGIESPRRAWGAWGKENFPSDSKSSEKSFKDTKQKRFFSLPKLTGFRNLR